MRVTVSELLRRRVLQVLGIYLAAGWGLLEFTDWAVTRFSLDASLEIWVVVAWALLALPVVLASWRLGERFPAAPTTLASVAAPRSVAVLPFVNRSEEPDSEYLSDGLADEIITTLSKIADLKVVSRTSSFAYRNTTEDVRAIGRRLGARAVLEGSVQRSGDRLRVTTQLIGVEDGYHLWSERFDRTMADVFRIQDEIAENVARSLEVLLRERERRALARVPTRDLRAYEAYLRGRRFVQEFRLRSFRYAREMFSRAIELDSSFALAYAGAAEVMALQRMYYPGVEMDLVEADHLSRRALELAPDLAEAHAARGAVLFVLDRLAEAEVAFEEAMELDPQLFSARYLHARVCFQLGRFDEAARRFDEALEIQEDYAAAFFAAQALEAAGMVEPASAAYRRALAVARDHTELNPDDPRAATMRAVAHYRVGEEEEGLRWAERALEVDPDDAGVRYNVGCLFSVAGEVERALRCLEEARDMGFGNREWLARDPDLDRLRKEPRFQAIMDTM